MKRRPAEDFQDKLCGKRRKSLGKSVLLRDWHITTPILDSGS